MLMSTGTTGGSPNLEDNSPPVSTGGEGEGVDAAVVDGADDAGGEGESEM